MISGTPGIGKSYFGLYVLARIVNQGIKNVYYQCKSGCYILNNQLITKVSNPVFFQDSLDEAPAGAWYIVDGVEPYFRNHIITLLITSPRRSTWHTFRKHFLASMYYVPVWTLDELQMCRPLIYSDYVTEEEVNTRFDKWGGSSRFVFCSAKKNYDNDMMFEIAIEKTNSELFMNAIGHSHVDSGEVSHLLMHYIVTVDGDYKYQGYQLGAASSYAFNKLANSLVDRMHQQVVTFLLGGSYTRNDPTATFRGHLFEGVAHNYLASGGKFSVRSLKTNNIEAIDIAPAKSVERFSSFPSQLEPGVYYQPISSCFPSIDAFRCSSNEVILFQMTIAKHHPILHDELKKLMICFPESYRVNRFYFVVPEKEYASLMKQNYYSKQKTVMKKIDSVVAAVEQYALCISLKRAA